MSFLPDARSWRRPLAVPGIVVGLVVLAIGMVIVRDGSVPAWERSTFHAVNDLPSWLYRPLWPFQQLGNLLVGPAVAIVAALMKRYRLAIAVIIATVAKLGLERRGEGDGQQATSRYVDRRRGAPARRCHGDRRELRLGSCRADCCHRRSGHDVPAGRWKIVPWVVVALVMVTRVYVGAHNPLDVVCGAASAWSIAGVINLFMSPRAGDVRS